MRICICIFAVWISGALALVNPSFQPSHLCGVYKAVVTLKVEKVDTEKHSLLCRVVGVPQGDFTPTEIMITAAAGMETGPMDLWDETRTLVAFVGKVRTTQRGEILLYAGDHRWHKLEIADPAQAAAWTWNGLGDEMLTGTFNGQAERLAELVEDLRNGTAYFPPQVHGKFNKPKIIAESRGAWAGVALVDLDGDGRLDVVACGPTGAVVLLGKGGGAFEDRTATLGLFDVKARSVSVADVNGDGQQDILLDAVVFLQKEGEFVRSDLLPPGAGERLKLAAFADLNQDGWPDILVSRTGGGLLAFTNREGTQFEDITAACGLDATATKGSGDGYVIAGDWNLDGRLDLFYSTGKGWLFEQGQDGRFVPVKHSVQFDLKAGPDFAPGLTGAGSFAPLWRPGRLDIAVPGDSSIVLATREHGFLESVTHYGNEILLASANQVASLAEDLDMDGTCDLLTFSRESGSTCMVHLNRGYGSFTNAALYGEGFLDAAPFKTGAGGVACGDVDGDGANDLIFAGLDGTVSLIINDCLASRQPSENPLYHQRKLEQTGIVSVKVLGKGTLGALVRLDDAGKQPVAVRQLGLAILTGCRGPDECNFAVREPGEHLLTVRYSDGTIMERKVEVSAGKRIEVTIRR